MDANTLHELTESKEFKQLVAKRWKVSVALTGMMLLVYFGFLILVAFKKELLATKLAEGLTLAIPMGVGILLLSWLATGWYVRWANHTYDQEVEALRKKLQQ